MLIGGFQPFSLSDYPGRTAAIVFTQGCNFRCPYCHNKELWEMERGAAGVMNEKGVLEHLAQRAGRLQGVVVTGGEPTIQDDLPAFCDKLKAAGLSVKLDTNGSRPAVLRQLIRERLVDYLAMDIKAPWQKYHCVAGCSVDVEVIRRSIETVFNSSLPHHFRTTYYRRVLSPEDVTEIRNMIDASPHVLQLCNDEGEQGAPWCV